jgi:hypothetical protein
MEHRALHSASHSARINHVLTGIAAAVDPGENEIGTLLAKQMKHAHDNAIGRSAANCESALGHLAKAQRIVERKRMRNARLVIFRRDHPNVVGKHARDLLAHFCRTPAGKCAFASAVPELVTRFGHQRYMRRYNDGQPYFCYWPSRARNR